MAGNNPSVEPPHYLIDGHQVRTAVVQGDDAREPHCWALEVIHADSEESSRRWAVETVLKQVDFNRVHFTTVVSNWMTPYFIGEQPPAPSPSVPWYVSHLVGNRATQCFRGTTLLAPRCSVVQSEDALELYHTLKAEERHVPCVVIAFHAGHGGSLLDAGRVALSLVGSANTYALASEAVNDELNYYLGGAYGLSPGMVRVFLPGLDKTNPHDSKRHRFLGESFIVERGPDAILRYLTNGLCRNAPCFRPGDLTSFADVLAERRKSKIAHLMREREVLATTKQMSEEELAMVWDEVESVSRKASEWEDLAKLAESERDELRRANGNLNIRVAEAERVRGRIQALTAQLEGVQRFGDLPESLPEVLDGVQRIFPSRLVVTENAFSTARRHSSDYPEVWGKLDGIRIAWKMVYSLAVDLHDIVYGRMAPNPEREYNDSVSDFEFALKESGVTRRDGSLMALRQIDFEGESLDITPHLKWGNRLPRMLRLYFAMDNVNKRFVVGHCGDHLDTASTRTMS